MIRARSNLFKTVVAASAVALSLGLGACGSDDDGSTESSSASSTTSAAATTTADSTTADAAAGDPTADELAALLTELSDPAKPAAEKTGLLVNGDARLANLEAMGTALASYGQLTYVVKDIVVTGTTATSNVDITSPHGTAPVPLTWENVDGTWILSDASGCQLLAFAQAPCA